MSAAASTAGAVDIDGGGGITITVNFITAPNAARVPGGAGAGLDYCELMDAVGHRLWMQTEGTHFMRGVRFIQAPEGFGSDIEWHADGGSWGVVGGFPAAPQMEFHEVGDDAGLVNLMSHEIGHLFYGLFDEYRATWFGSLGVCSGWDSASPATVQYCDDNADCGAPWTGTCVFPGGTCLNSPATSCAVNADCGAGTTAICFLDGSTETQPPGQQVDFCQDETNLTAGGGVDRDRICQMQNTQSRGRWCDSTNHIHQALFNGQTVQMGAGDLGGYDCWNMAANGKFVDSSNIERLVNPSFTGHVDLANTFSARTLGVYTDFATLDGAYPIAAGAMRCDFLVNAVDPDDNSFLMVDSSGSMNYTDLAGQLAADLALEGAIFFYNATAPARSAGIATYDTDVTELVAYAPVAPIGDLATTPGGLTNIAAAIDYAANSIRTSAGSGGPNSNLNVVVLSDGKQTVAGDPVAAARAACDGTPSVVVNTISFGDADVSQLEAIADECGGFSWVAGARDATQGGGGFDQPNPREMRTALARSRFHLRRESEALEDVDFLTGYPEEVRTFQVPAGTTALDMGWLGNAATVEEECSVEICNVVPGFPLLEFELEAPDGAVFPGVLGPAGVNYATARVPNPLPGVWRARVDASGIRSRHSALEVTWVAWVDNPSLAAQAWVRNPRAALNQPVTLLATLRYPSPLTGLSVHAVVTHRGTETVVALHDDGAHDDDRAGDGIYGGVFNAAGATLSAGAYRVKASLTALAGTSRAVAVEQDGSAALPGALDDAVIEAETSFRLSDGFAVDPNDPLNVGQLELGFAELTAGTLHTDLQLTVIDFPVHEDVIRVSLGPDIEISNVRVDCLTCSTTNASYEALVTFDAVVGASAVGLRTAAIQRGVRTLRSIDQVNIVAGAPPCVLGSEQLDLRDRSFVLGNLNAQAFSIGNDADILGDVLAAGNGSLGHRSTIDGFAILGGTFTGDRAAVSGGVVEGASVTLPSLVQRTFPVGSGSTQVPNGAVVTLTPGTRGNMILRARSRVTFAAGTFNFASLEVEPDVIVNAPSDVQINVQGALRIGDRAAVTGASPEELLLYTNGNDMRVGTDVDLTGIVVAPRAAVQVFSRAQVNGCIGGRRVTFEPDVILDASDAELPTE